MSARICLLRQPCRAAGMPCARMIMFKGVEKRMTNYRTLADSQYEAFKKDLGTLVSFESVRDTDHAAKGAPFGPNIEKALNALLEMGKRDGFETANYDGYAGLITMGDGDESVGILGHLDVVPLGQGWTHNPLELTEENGYLFGRGVLDDKGPLLAGYYAMKLVKDSGIPLKRKVMLIAGTDEESGMGGIREYVKTGPIPTMGFTPDADFPVIYGEKGNLHIALDSEAPTLIESFEAGERPNIVIPKARAVLKTDQLNEEQFHFYLRTNGLQGSARQEDGQVILEMTGTAAHGSLPYLGNNAGVHLLNYIGEAYDDSLAKNLYFLLKDWKGTPEKIDINGLYMGFLTMNPGIITVQDGRTHVLIDIRYPNDTDPDTILAGFETACSKLNTPIVPTIEHSGKPLFVDPNSPLVRNLMASYAEYTGDTFSPAITIGGGTYAKMFDNFVAFGPEKPWERAPEGMKIGGCHEADEGISKNALLEAIAIYADAIVRLANQ